MWIDPRAPTYFDRWAFYSLKVDETVYADPFVYPRANATEYGDPIKPEPGEHLRDERHIKWIHDDAALAEVLEAAKRRGHNPRPK